jgi:hypothetical protein
VLALGGRVVRPAARLSAESARGELTAWKAVPPATRRLVYRSLLAVGLLITLSERTIPALGRIGGAVGEFTGKVIKGTAELIGNLIAEALRELLKPQAPPGWLGTAAYLACAVALICLWVKLLPWPGRGGIRHA